MTVNVTVNANFEKIESLGQENRGVAFCLYHSQRRPTVQTRQYDTEFPALEAVIKAFSQCCARLLYFEPPWNARQEKVSYLRQTLRTRDCEQQYRGNELVGYMWFPLYGHRTPESQTIEEALPNV